MTNHKVVVVRQPTYPFKARWECVCGVQMPNVPFGIFLQRAFAKHLEEVNVK